jgi:hypothetical protein
LNAHDTRWLDTCAEHDTEVCPMENSDPLDGTQVAVTGWVPDATGV